MNFEIFAKSHVVNKPRLRKAARVVFSKYLENKSQIELIFVNEEEIQELNKKYRKNNHITDVLSFQIENKPFIGQIFICYTRAKEQADFSDINVDDEIQNLFVHGLVHLLGHDHETKKDQEKMIEIENEIKKGEK